MTSADNKSGKLVKPSGLISGFHKPSNVKSLKDDKHYLALPPGKRESKFGKTYYEC
jgi:hypothetical protein